MSIVYERVGRMIEDMPMAGDYEVTTVLDVNGETHVTPTKGANTVDISAVKINGNSQLAKFIDTAVERGWELSQLDCYCVAVRFHKHIGTDYKTGLPAAFRQPVSLVPGNYASGNQALEAAATAHLVGERVWGTYDKEAVGSRFTAETAPPAPSEIHYKDGDASRSDFAFFLEFDDTQT